MRERRRTASKCVGLVFAAVAVSAQIQAPDSPSAAELRQAEADIPKLVNVLALRPGMTVADVGAGFGAMVTVLSRTLGPSSRIYATDIGERQLAVLRRDRTESVTVLQGSDRSTNLPDLCCDAIYMRDVYHHFTHPEDIDKSLFAALKPGGRLAVIDFRPAAGSGLPDGVNPNRGGHGVPPAIVQEETTTAGFTFERLIEHWPDENGGYFLVLLRKE